MNLQYMIGIEYILCFSVVIIIIYKYHGRREYKIDYAKGMAKQKHSQYNGDIMTKKEKKRCQRRMTLPALRSFDSICVRRDRLIKRT